MGDFMRLLDLEKFLAMYHVSLKIVGEKGLYLVFANFSDDRPPMVCKAKTLSAAIDAMIREVSHALGN